MIALDFDGTITRRDTLHLIVDAFGERAVWDEIEPRLNAGEISIDQAMQAEFATVRATPDEVRDLVRAEAGLRDGFAAFVGWARAAGHRTVVLSNGFASVIGDLLERAGVGDLPFRSHDAVFTPEGSRILWSDRGATCSLCNRPCKRFDLDQWRTGDPVVYVGDGVSDRCVAQAADRVFARDGLADYLAGIGVAFEPFRDFHQLRDDLSRPAVTR